MGIQIEVGKWYLTRDERIIQIVTQYDDKHCVDPFRSSDGRQYYPNGIFKEHTESKCDIVREISHVGILMEILGDKEIYYKIKGAGNRVTAEVRKKPFPQIAIEFGGNDDVFNTLLSAYLKFEERRNE